MRLRVTALPFALTTDAAGAGTADSSAPVCGEVIEIRAPNAASALTTGGSADFALTRVLDGGTIWAASNQAAPLSVAPRLAVVTTGGGTTAYQVGGQSVYDSGGGVPVDGYLRLAVAQGALSQSGTLFIYVRQ